MGAQEAVESPRFQTEHFYSSFGNHEFVPGRLSLENRISKTTIEALATLGHQVNVTGEWSNTSSPVLIVRKNEVLDGGADIRRARYIFGR
jgi:gamma-glutamyltranspeptidase/glutathione hydrolase